MESGDVVAYITTAPQTLAAAEALLELAHERNSFASPLIAAATVALASSLDQGTKGLLDYLFARARYEEELDRSAILRLRSKEYGLFFRLCELPRVMSGYTFSVRRDHPTISAIRKLITLRNELAHPEDSVRTVTEIPAQSTGPDSVVVDGVELSRLSIGRNLWTTLTLEEGNRFRIATHHYFNEVLTKANSDLTAGPLLIRTSSH